MMLARLSLSLSHSLIHSLSLTHLLTHSLSYTHTHTQTWAEPFAAGERRDVSVSYVVREPVAGLLFSAPDAAYPTRPAYVVSDNETECARYWLPCVDYPTVRPTLAFHLHAPPGHTAVANGVCSGTQTHADGSSTSSYVRGGTHDMQRHIERYLCACVCVCVCVCL
jgi:hypothetical protein